MKNKDRRFYVYIFLDPRKLGEWKYEDLSFNCQPFYVGQGSGYRLMSHMCPSNLDKDDFKSRKILKIIRESGQEPIRYKIYENLTEEESLEIEGKIISHFGKICDGTGILCNIKDGVTRGHSGWKMSEEQKQKLKELDRKDRVYAKGPNSRSEAIDQYSPDGVLIRTWDYLQQIEDELGSPLGNALYHPDRLSCKGFIWRKASERDNPLVLRDLNQEKKVYQYSLDGDFIQSFESMILATRETGCLDISSCASGIVSQCGGYRWFSEYHGERVPALENYLSRNPQKVYQYAQDGIFIRSYESIAEASSVTKIDVWKYFNGNTRLPYLFRFFKTYQGEEIEESYVDLSQLKSRPIESYDDDNKVINKYESIKSAGRNLSSVIGKSAQACYDSIRRSLKTGKKSFGVYWRVRESF